MGLQQSKEALLYQQVNYGNIEGIKALHKEGAALEWFDKDKRTPLIVACMNPQLYDVAKCLIELGANVNAYRPGAHGGTALHHAAKRGLAKTVLLLLLNGANALAVNDDYQTPLDVARAKGHSNVVRTIESHICFFSGWLRELYGPGFLEALVPQLLSRKIWVVVVPSGTRNPRKPLKIELAIYTNLQDAKPRTTITLWKAKIEQPKFNQPVPVLSIFDKATRTRYKLASSEEGEKQQLQWLCNACRGIPQVTQSTMQPQSHTPVGPPTTAPSGAEDVELAMARNASLMSATEQRPPIDGIHHESTDRNMNGWESSLDNSTHNGGLLTGGQKHSEASSSGCLDEPPTDAYNGWDVPETGTVNNPAQNITSLKTSGSTDSADNSSHNGWGFVGKSGSPSKEISTGWSDKPAEEVHNGWGTTETAPITNLSQSSSISAASTAVSLPEIVPVPSAPPAPESEDYGPIQYPSIDFSPVDMAMPSAKNEEAIPNQTKEEIAASSSCVICLDAPVEGACIPCGHMAGCMSCLNGIKAKKWGCPVCRSKIDQVIRLYAV